MTDIDDKQPSAPEEPAIEAEASTDKAPQDTSDSPTLQGQENTTEKAPQVAENSGENPKSKPNKDEDVDKPFDIKDFRPKTELTNEILGFDNNMNSQLEWKEKLKLLTLDVNINAAYYHDWVHEANRIFARSVMLRRRLKKYAQRGD